MELNFSNLPLAEVVIRFGPNAPVPLGHETVNRFREAVSERFPTVFDPPRIETPPGAMPPMVVGPSGISGVSFAAQDLSQLLFLQSNLVSLRWANLGIDSQPYPRYPALRDSWEWLQPVLSELLSGYGGYRVVQMTYNVLTDPVIDLGGAGWSVLSQSFLGGLRGPSGRLADFSIAWNEADGNELRLMCQPVAIFDQAEHRLYMGLQTIGARVLADGEDVLDALDRIHKRLLELFATVTSTEAQQSWGRMS